MDAGKVVELWGGPAQLRGISPSSLRGPFAGRIGPGDLGPNPGLRVNGLLRLGKPGFGLWGLERKEKGFLNWIVGLAAGGGVRLGYLILCGTILLKIGKPGDWPFTGVKANLAQKWGLGPGIGG